MTEEKDTKLCPANGIQKESNKLGNCLGVKSRLKTYVKKILQMQ